MLQTPKSCKKFQSERGRLARYERYRCWICCWHNSNRQTQLTSRFAGVGGRAVRAPAVETSVGDGYKIFAVGKAVIFAEPEF